MYVERELGTLGDDLAGWIVLVLPSLENVDFGLWCWRGRNIPVWGLGARGETQRRRVSMMSMRRQRWWLVNLCVRRFTLC